MRDLTSAVDEFGDFFKRVDRIVIPTMKDYEKAGIILSGLQSKKGYGIRKSASITNDCLLAASARSTGATLYTQNRKDFEAIYDIFDFKVSFV